MSNPVNFTGPSRPLVPKVGPLTQQQRQQHLEAHMKYRILAFKQQLLDQKLRFTKIPRVIYTLKIALIQTIGSQKRGTL